MKHSMVLTFLIKYGGGAIVPSRRGGHGIYSRLEGNSLVKNPLPVCRAVGRDGIEKLYPAAFVDAYPSTGFDLIPITTAALAKEYNPELFRVSLIVRLFERGPEPSPIPPAPPAPPFDRTPRGAA